MKPLYILLLTPLLLALCGCETKEHARAQARAAYVAGRAAEYRRTQEQQRTKLRVVGNVVTSEVDWEDGMTLAAVLLVAEYQGKEAPGEIIIDRHGQRLRVDMVSFLKGEDVYLDPGDIVIINP